MAKRPRRIPQHILDAFRKAARPIPVSRLPQDIGRETDAESGGDGGNGDCPDCKGTGEYVGLLTREPCRACHGEGRLTLEQRLERLAESRAARFRIETTGISPGDQVQLVAHGRPLRLHCTDRDRDGRVTFRKQNDSAGVIVMGSADVLEVRPDGSLAVFTPATADLADVTAPRSHGY